MGVVVGVEVGGVVVGGFVGLGVATAGSWFGTVKETGHVLVLRKPGTTGQGEAAVVKKYKVCNYILITDLHDDRGLCLLYTTEPPVP